MLSSLRVTQTASGVARQKTKFVSSCNPHFPTISRPYKRVFIQLSDPFTHGDCGFLRCFHSSIRHDTPTPPPRPKNQTMLHESLDNFRKTSSVPPLERIGEKKKGSPNRQRMQVGIKRKPNCSYCTLLCIVLFSILFAYRQLPKNR